MKNRSLFGVRTYFKRFINLFVNSLHVHHKQSEIIAPILQIIALLQENFEMHLDEVTVLNSINCTIIGSF